MLTAGTPNAAAPDVSMCFISTDSQVQYDLGPKTYVSSPKLILTHTPSELVEKMTQNKTVRKRSESQLLNKMTAKRGNLACQPQKGCHTPHQMTIAEKLVLKIETLGVIEVYFILFFILYTVKPR